MAAEDILSMLDAGFHEFVVADCNRRVSPEEADDLRNPLVAMRWRLCLGQIKRDIERQITRKRMEIEESRVHALATGNKAAFLGDRVRYMEWHARSISMLARVEGRMAEATALLGPARLDRMSRRTLLTWAASLIPDAGPGAAWHAAFRDEVPVDTSAE